MNEPAIRMEEQIISLFPGMETLVCQGWILKKMGGQFLVYPLYYKFSEGNIPDNIQRCEEISRQSGKNCVFRIVEHTNYHLSSILTDTGYCQTSRQRKNCRNNISGLALTGPIFTAAIKRRIQEMDLQNEKCVMVIDENLPLGIIANTAAIMGITLGKQMPEVVGADVYDKTGKGHLGIIEFPVPILKGNEEVIKSIRERLYEPEFSDLTVVDFSDLAQGCKTYDEFIQKMKDISETELNYFGIAICGAKKKVNKLTGSMALLR